MLFYACRYGQLSVSNWLLDQDADVKMQLKAEPYRTQLHCGATFDDLLKALPVTLRQNRIYFSIARQPLFFRDQTNGLLECICLFKTDIYHVAKKLHEMPFVTLKNEPYAR